MASHKLTTDIVTAYWQRYLSSPKASSGESCNSPKALYNPSKHKHKPSSSQPQAKRKYYAPSNMTAIFIKCGKTEYGPLRSPKEIALAIDEITSHPPQDAKWPELLSLVAKVNEEQQFFIAVDNTEFYFTVQKRNC